MYPSRSAESFTYTVLLSLPPAHLGTLASEVEAEAEMEAEAEAEAEAVVEAEGLAVEVGMRCARHGRSRRARRCYTRTARTAA